MEKVVPLTRPRKAGSWRVVILDSDMDHPKDALLFTFWGCDSTINHKLPNHPNLLERLSMTRFLFPTKRSHCDMSFMTVEQSRQVSTGIAGMEIRHNPPSCGCRIPTTALGLVEKQPELFFRLDLSPNYFGCAY